MRIEQIGIGETTGTTEMLLDPVSGFVQAKRFDHTMWESPQTVQIRTERIADAAVRLHIVPQYIKLDIEAYEFEAIKGSLEFLACHDDLRRGSVLARGADFRGFGPDALEFTPALR